MPKHEPLTPKAISNRIKAKGLQKLRWYCQMCQKQCRDQNGFKCHLTSESHQRQLMLFAECPGRYMNEFSSEFQKAFLDILRRQFGGKRVKANAVYQEYIKNKHHVHMNATGWYTLTGFVNHLARAGICKVDKTDKGWFVQYIDQEVEKRREKMAQKIKSDVAYEERQQQLVMRQAERAKEVMEKKGQTVEESQPTELSRVPDEKISFKFGGALQSAGGSVAGPNILKQLADRQKSKAPSVASSRASSRKPKSALEEIIESESRRKVFHRYRAYD